jgi:uncharacterized protein (DUF924 family)
LYQWRNEPEGRLAEIIVLDQFSRNIYRGLPLAFAFDPLALVLAQEAISGEVHKMLAAEKKAFLCNAVLGRTSTKEEKEFLLQQDSSF